MDSLSEIILYLEQNKNVYIMLHRTLDDKLNDSVMFELTRKSSKT
jgi:hypothetical protein